MPALAFLLSVPLRKSVINELGRGAGDGAVSSLGMEGGTAVASANGNEDIFADYFRGPAGSLRAQTRSTTNRAEGRCSFGRFVAAAKDSGWDSEVAGRALEQHRDLDPGRRLHRDSECDSAR
jgi:hypothetical protein